jgi:hypothetical protein
LAWLFLPFLTALGEEFLRLRDLGCLHLAEENGKLILGDLVAAQKPFERVHQEHLNAAKFSKDVHLHLECLPTASPRSHTSRAHSRGVFPARDAASSMAFASSGVSVVLRLSDRRSRPRNFSEVRS